MKLGNLILKYRKQKNLSQEDLAKEIGVTRQTISKWELNETTPDIKQAKELSKIFKISLDELTDNDIKSIMVEKISNTEKLAGLVLKVLKCIGVCFLIALVIDLIALIIYTSSGKFSDVQSGATTICEIENNQYEIEFRTDKYFKCDNCSTKMKKEIEELIDFNDIEDSMRNIEKYFKFNNGTCE